MAIDRINDTIDFAKELVMECELRDMAGDEYALKATVDILNQQLIGSNDDTISLIKAAEAFKLPDDYADVEFMNEEDIYRSRIENPLMKGRVYGFEWFGSVSLTGFGVRLMGVSFLQPKIRHASSVFIPVETIDLRLAA